MYGPSVYWSWPTLPTSIFPEDLPRTLPPPINESSFRSPFGIDAWLFNFALRWYIPVTFASSYIVIVFSLNAYNRSRSNRPWWIARQTSFNYFVVLHNAVLTVYSAATFLAMCRAIAHTWPGLNSNTGLAGVADALCKLHGPRGLGDAATFNTTINIWEAKNTFIKLGYDGNPDPTDVGRLWNEGLAFWGWMFYISKFYEVLDTFIILAKGKRSATLQTYHHSGAMLCMWAGIRYMSPPIWMFVFVNSFIHALMYTYFTLSALGVRVPTRIKRALTSMQIAQFLWGASYAAAHLFIQYDMPIATPYHVAAAVQAAASSVSSVASAASYTVSKIVESPAASGTLVALAKKLLLRAAGEEGLAERVGDVKYEPVTPYVERKIEQFGQKTTPRWETRWRQDWTKVNCIDTSGEAFAIYLNLLYLAPLTFLFARFFIKAYTGRGRSRQVSQASKKISDSGKLAELRTEEIVEQFGRTVEESIQNNAEFIKKEAERNKVDVSDVHEQLRRDVQLIRSGSFGRDRRVSDHVQNFEKNVRTAAENAREQSRKLTKGNGSSRRSSPSKKPVDVTKEEAPKSPSEAKPEIQHDAVVEQAIKEPAPSSEPALKQDVVLESSESTRPGTDSETRSEVTVGQVTQTSETQGEKLYSEAVKEESDGKSSSQGEGLFGTVKAQSTAEDDTDAMGKSGAIVDLAAAKAEEALQVAAETAPKDNKPLFRPAGTAPT